MRIVVEDIAVVPVVVSCVVAAVRFRHLALALRYLAVLIFFETAMEIVSRVLQAQQIENLFLLPIDTPVEFGLLAWMYRRAFWPSALSRWLPAVVVVFAVVSLFSYADSANYLLRFNAGQRFVESLLVIGLVLRYFYSLLSELVVVHLEREPLFLVSVGLLLYFSGNVFIFVFSNYAIQHSATLSLRLWNIHAWLYTVLYSMYAWALWIAPSTRK